MISSLSRHFKPNFQRIDNCVMTCCPTHPSAFPRLFPSSGCPKATSWTSAARRMPAAPARSQKWGGLLRPGGWGWYQINGTAEAVFQWKIPWKWRFYMFYWENHLFLWAMASMAMWNNQRVSKISNIFQNQWPFQVEVPTNCIFWGLCKGYFGRYIPEIWLYSLYMVQYL